MKTNPPLRRLLERIFIVLVLFLALATPPPAAAASNCQAGDATWVKAGDGDWSEASAWSTGSVPIASTHVCLDPTNATQIMITQLYSAYSVYIGPHVLLEVTCASQVSQAGLNVVDQVTIEKAGELMLDTQDTSCSLGVNVSHQAGLTNNGLIYIANTPGQTLPRKGLSGVVKNNGTINVFGGFLFTGTPGASVINNGIVLVGAPIEIDGRLDQNSGEIRYFSKDTREDLSIHGTFNYNGGHTTGPGEPRIYGTASFNKDAFGEVFLEGNLGSDIPSNIYLTSDKVINLVRDTTNYGYIFLMNAPQTGSGLGASGDFYKFTNRGIVDVMTPSYLQTNFENRGTLEIDPSGSLLVGSPSGSITVVNEGWIQASGNITVEAGVRFSQVWGYLKIKLPAEMRFTGSSFTYVNGTTDFAAPIFTSAKIAFQLPPPTSTLGTGAFGMDLWGVNTVTSGTLPANVAMSVAGYGSQANLYVPDGATVLGTLHLISMPIAPNGPAWLVCGNGGGRLYLKGLLTTSGLSTEVHCSLNVDSAASILFDSNSTTALTSGVVTSGTVTLSTGALLSMTGDYMQNGGSTSLGGQASELEANKIVLNGGLITGIGKLKVKNGVQNKGGKLNQNAIQVLPNSPAGVNQPLAEDGIAINGNYVQGPGGALAVGLSGTPSSGAYGRLVVSGQAAVDGRLELYRSNGYLPAVGDQYSVLSAASLSGAFASAALDWGGVKLSYEPSGVDFTVLTIILRQFLPALFH